MSMPVPKSSQSPAGLAWLIEDPAAHRKSMTPSAARQDPALEPSIRAAIAKAKLEDDVIRTLGSTPALGAIPYDQLKLIARVLSISAIEREKIAAADALREFAASALNAGNWLDDPFDEFTLTTALRLAAEAHANLIDPRVVK